MTSRRSVVRALVAVEGKSISQQMDGIRRAIESGLVDVQTITTFKRLLSFKLPASVTISKTPKSSSSLASTARGKKARPAASVDVVPSPETFPSAEWVSATKTIVMKSMTALAAEIESRASDKTQQAEGKGRLPVGQGTRNIAMCTKLALEALRQWQDHQDITASWVNKAYCGYIAKLVALELVKNPWNQKQTANFGGGHGDPRTLHFKEGYRETIECPSCAETGRERTSEITGFVNEGYPCCGLVKESIV